MYCAKCGKENDDDAKFCEGCGCSINQPPVKENASIKLIVLLVMGVVLLLAVILILQLHRKKEQIDITEASTTTVVATTLEETTSEVEAKIEVALKEERLSAPFTGEAADEKSNGVSPAEYVLPESDSRVYTTEELEMLSEEQLRLARNEIFARRGRKFSSDDLQTYFSAQSWYTPTYEADAFDALGDSIFNEFEIGNRKQIVELEGGNSTLGFNTSSNPESLISYHYLAPSGTYIWLAEKEITPYFVSDVVFGSHRLFNTATALNDLYNFCRNKRIDTTTIEWGSLNNTTLHLIADNWIFLLHKGSDGSVVTDYYMGIE